MVFDDPRLEHIFQETGIHYISTMRCLKCGRHLVLCDGSLYCYAEFEWMDIKIKRLIDEYVLGSSIEITPAEFRRIEKEIEDG